jgi:translation initiation factor 4E
MVGNFNTVEGFWAHYSHMVPAGELSSTSDIHIFRNNIRPMWEDEENKLGGKWVLRLRKGLASQMWENLVFGIIGNQFDVGDEICGAVCSIRYQEDLISIWTKSARAEDVSMKIKETMKRLLSLPNSTVLDYKAHSSALKGSGFRQNGGGRGGGGGFR